MRCRTLCDNIFVRRGSLQWREYEEQTSHQRRESERMKKGLQINIFFLLCLKQSITVSSKVEAHIVTCIFKYSEYFVRVFRTFYRCTMNNASYFSPIHTARKLWTIIQLYRDFQFPPIYEAGEISVRLNAYVNNEKKIRSWSSIEINSWQSCYETGRILVEIRGRTQFCTCFPRCNVHVCPLANLIKCAL